MNKWELFQKFLITSEEQIQTVDFLYNSIIIIILTVLLELTYRKCGKSLSNRKSFAFNFIMLGFTTMLIISVVKSSLALSLGLVGALSIVRFRAAIKEPEELTYLFFVISTGLGLGANLRGITIIAFLVMMAIIWGRYFITDFKKAGSYNLYFTVSGTNENLQLTKISETISKHFKRFELKRFDEQENFIEVAFLIETNKIENLEICKNELKQLNESLKVSYIDNRN
jgi:hypothetical protein